MRHRRLIVPALAALLAGCSGSSSPSFNCPGPVASAFDSDGDLLTDAQEAVLGTDPKKAATDGDGWTDYEEVMAGTNPLDPNSHPGPGQVATIKRVASANDLIGGFRAKGQVGDWLITNDKIHAIVQNATDSQIQVGTYGGNL